MKKILKTIISAILETGVIILFLFALGIFVNFIEENFWLIIPVSLFTLYLLITRVILEDKR